MRLRHKMSNLGCKTQKALQTLTVPVIKFCCKTLIILLGFCPVKPRRSMTSIRQVGIEANAPTMMGMNSNL